MIKVYIAFDKHDLPVFKQGALVALTGYHDILLFKLRKGLMLADIALVYNNTTKGSVLREFMVRRAATEAGTAGHSSYKAFAGVTAELPDFAADLLKTLFRAAGIPYDNPLLWPLEEPKPSEGLPPQKET